MSWLLFGLLGLAEAAEYRKLELADGRALAVEVLETGPDGLRVRVPAGVMRLPFEDILTIEPATEREWMTQAPQRVLLLPTMADPRLPTADAVALDEVLRGTLAGTTGVKTFRLAELPAPESLRAALGGCGADAACVQSVLPKAGVDLALLPGLDPSGASVELRFAKAPTAGRRLAEPFPAGSAERVAAARALVDRALGLEPAPAAVAVTPAADPAVPPAAGTLPTAPPSPAAPSPTASAPTTAASAPATAAPTATAAPVPSPAATSPGASSSTAPVPSPAATAPTTAAPAATTSTAPATGPTISVVPAEPSVAVAPIPGALPSPASRRPLTLPPKADLALSFVPVPGFPAWVRGDPKRGAFATLAAIPTTAAIVAVEGAAGARKEEVLAVSVLGYYASCVVYSRAFLPIVRPVEGGAAVSAVGRF